MKRPANGAAVLLLALCFSAAATASAQQSQTTSKKSPAPATSAPSGEGLFNSYCAACHGKDAKGDGPAAAALKVPPPDLTTLGKRHGGKFPADYFTSVLQYGVEEVKAHGSKDMPVWGPLFGPSGSLRKSQEMPLAEARDVNAAVAEKIRSLSQYVESLQAK
jgi:mono/diheme cytochrome c family protein